MFAGYIYLPKNLLKWKIIKDRLCLLSDWVVKGDNNKKKTNSNGRKESKEGVRLDRGIWEEFCLVSDIYSKT